MRTGEKKKEKGNGGKIALRPPATGDQGSMGNAKKMTLFGEIAGGKTSARRKGKVGGNKTFLMIDRVTK